MRRAVITATFNYVGETNETQLQSLTIIDGGAGYTTVPTIIIDSPNYEGDDVRANVSLTILI